MAKFQYVTIPEKDLGAGIDQQSAENQIPPGYCEDIENADPKATGQIIKRTGYQGYAGNIPVRVTQVDYTIAPSPDIMCFTLDTAIELPNGRSSPIIISGRTSAEIGGTGGDFSTTDAIVYYDGFAADVRQTLATGSSSFQETVAVSAYPLMGLAKSTSEANNDNTQIFPDTNKASSVAVSSLHITTVAYTNNTGAELTAFSFVDDNATGSSDVYVNAAQTIDQPSSPETVSITGATHGLGTNFMVKAWDVTTHSGTNQNLEVIPDSVTIDVSTGDVDVIFVNNSSSFDVRVVLYKTPVDNIAIGAVSASSSASVTIDTSVTGGTDFAFVSCYLISGTDLVQVIPNSIVNDSDAQEITVNFTNNDSVGKNFKLVWDFATITTNQICVEPVNTAVTGLDSDTNPQISIWGLDHKEIYGTRVAREGWTNHIDSYRAPAEQRLISGLGGNLNAARLRSEGSNSTTYLMPLVYTKIRNALTTSDQIIGPAFYDTGETPGRTAGFITGDNGGTNYFEITDIAYDSGSGEVRYTLSAPNMSIEGTLASIITAGTNLPDFFTATQCGYTAHNGDFAIDSISSPTATTLLVGVTNSLVVDENLDESDVGGLGGVFTDHVELAAGVQFIPGDIVKSTLITDNLGVTVLSGTSTGTPTIAINNVTEIISLPASIVLHGERTSQVIPVQNISETATVTNFVKGDMLNYTGIDRQLRILSINQLSAENVSITGNGTTATVTVLDTSTLFVGKKLLLTGLKRAGESSYTGVQTITDIPTTTTFEFLSTATVTEDSTIEGKTIEIDESLTFEDVSDFSNQLAVDSRWIPIEHPDDTFGLTPATRTTYFDTNSESNQEIIRSTMVQDNLYLTNSDDEVMKFDGLNLYRAGLFRWQPGLFTAIDTTGAAGKIENSFPTITYISVADSKFEFTGSAAVAERAFEFKVGDVIRDDYSDAVGIYTVESVNVTTSAGVSVKGIVKVDREIDTTGSGTLTLSRIANYKYYFRLNAVDSNNNVVASAVTGSDDFVVQLSVDAAVNLKLVGMPVWDIYDYDRLEVQIYRTKGNTVAPFYLLTTLVMEFDSDNGYITYTDTDSDDTLRDLDPINTALKGAELGTQFEQPLRAKYCTTAGNKLVLGNLKGYPELDIRFIGDSAKLVAADFTANALWQFRKDNTDTSTGTDMVDYARYEFRNTSSSTTIVPNTAIAANAGVDFTITVANSAAVGDWVYLYHAATTGTRSLLYAGWWQISAASGSDITINFDKAATGTTTDVDEVLFASDPTDIPVPVDTDGNFDTKEGNPSTALSYLNTATIRLAMAINASMRKVDTTITGFDDFAPWMIANAGSEFNVGQLLIKHPKVLSTNLEVVIPTLNGKFDVFVNNIKRVSADQASSSTRLYPSRVIASYQNYPEIFDNPTAVLDSESASVIDVNSADGQVITAIIPFFGDAAFGAAQKSGIVVVFKTNSVYLVDLSAKDSGLNPVQRLETRGKGCSSPFSVSVTRAGIMFANDTGIYRLGRDLKVEYIGRKYERKWLNNIETDQLGIFTGHHDPFNNSYKLSYTTTDETENNLVAVYNHTREYQPGPTGAVGDGSWTTYTNHPTTGWANLAAESFFSSTSGRVFQVRRLGAVTDYRDDNLPIEMTILTRAIDAGESGRRKIIGKIITHFRSQFQSEGTSLQATLDLKTIFQDTDDFIIKVDKNDTGTGDVGAKKVQTIVSVINEKVGVYVQLKYLNSTIDEVVEIVGIDLRIAAKTAEGMQEAIETTS